MNRVRRNLVLALAGLALLSWVAVTAGENVWVSSDGNTHAIQGDAKVVLLEDGDGLDLSELADGETRVIGSGDSAVTVSRDGDMATISRTAAGQSQALDVRCDITRDSCKVVTTAADPDRVMIVVRKERECANGEGDCDMPFGIEALPGEGHQIMIRKVVRCDDAGNCDESEDTSSSAHVTHFEGLPGHGAEGHVMFVGSADDAGAGADVIVMQAKDSLLLRCPEGDATLRVNKDEVDEVFLCPRHSTPMTKAKSPVGVRELRSPHGARSQ